MLLLTALVSFVGNVAGADPCWFIGLRLAKTRSRCVEGMCSELSVSEDEKGVFPSELMDSSQVNISCEDAARIATSLTESVPVSMYRSWDEALSHVGAQVIPAFRSVIYSKRHLSSDVIDVMAKFDQHLVQAYRSGADLAVVIESHSISSLFVLWSTVILWSHHVPFSVDVSNGLTAQCIHFGMDLLSVLGPQADIRFELDSLEPNAMTVAGCNAANNPVAYRPVYALELVLRFADALVSNPSASVAIASAMTQLVRNPADIHAASMVSSLVVSLGASESATDALLRAQLISEVCPHLTRILLESQLLQDMTKTAVSLIYLCKPIIGERGGIEASIRLAANPSKSIPTLELTSLLQGLVDWEFEWINGFSPTQQDVPLLLGSLASHFYKVYDPFIREEGVTRFKTRSHFQSDDLFELIMIGLGRMLALCIRYQIPCSTDFGLSPVLEAIIERPIEDELIIAYIAPGFSGASPDHIDKTLMRNIREPLFYITAGVTDVIGPAGIYALRMH